MAEEKRQQTTGSAEAPTGKNVQSSRLNQAGDPGRTPGAAEGDEETIDQDIRDKEADGKL